MRMNLGKLLAEGYIQPLAKNPKLVEEALASAEADIATAKRNLESGDLDWALAIAYDAMLQAGVALMYWHGYRPASEGSHLAVVKFCAEVLPRESSELVTRFNKLRMRRHKVIYEKRGTVTKEEAAGSIARAEEFIKSIRATIKGELVV